MISSLALDISIKKASDSDGVCAERSLVSSAVCYKGPFIFYGVGGGWWDLVDSLCSI